ncbi:hypothetical protein DRQ36_06190 [bacterium]|nr:MAG: hypothetical protein DRQ36_06190 [bacterium]
MTRASAGLLLLSATAILSFAPTGKNGFCWNTPDYISTPPNSQSRSALSELIAETGVPWQGTWNAQTGLPHRLMSGGFGFTVADSADAVAKCRDFVAGNRAIFGYINPEELEPLAVRKKLDIWYITFLQTVAGITVEGARADFRIKSGKLAMIGADLVPGLTEDSPSINASIAAELAKSKFDFDNWTSELYFFAPANGRLAWKITGENRYPRHRWICYIDAHSGELLAAYDDIRTEVSGMVYGKIHPMFGADIPEDRALEYLIVGLEGYAIDTTDISGYYSADISPGDGWHISAELEGPFVHSIPIGAAPVELYVLADTAILDIHFEPPDAALDETDAFYHVNVVHDWVKSIDPDFTGMDYSVPCYVREVEPPCPNNAFWDGTAIHMGAGAAGYDNWGYYADVYYHEYGHGITHHQYPAGTLPYTGESGAIDEACSDYTACTITDEPDIGEGGLSPYGMLRSMENDLMYPDDIENEVHADGRIIGGCFWDMRDTLGACLSDTLVHFAKYGLPTDFEAFLDEVLLVDDDDGDILNGTPHFLEIYAAFQNHGVGRFRVDIYHEPLADTEDSLGPYPVKCIVASTLPPDESSVTLSYSTDYGSVWDDISMSPTGIEREYSADIPGSGFDIDIWYFIGACDTLGICGTLPDSAPAYYFSFAVATDTIAPKIEHKPMMAVAAPAAPYDIKFKVEDNLGIGEVSLIWALNEGAPETLSIEPDSSGKCVGIIDPAAVTVGDSIGYKIIVTDGAGSPNTTVFPEDGYHWFNVVRSVWLDFEADDGGFTATSGWEWGNPGAEIGAHSGDKVWGTVLSGDYANDADYELETESYDISDWDAVTLEMWMFIGSEMSFDGGNIWVSSDGGVRWVLLTPVGGYPAMLVEALREPGFSGYTENWVKIECDLTPFLDDLFGVLAFKFVFKSNAGNTAPGWFIDDVALLERQIILPPSRLIAESGHDLCVPLHWKPPDPEAVEGTRTRPMAFLGYNIYRADSPGDYPPDPINSTPAPDTFYSDTAVINETTYYYRVTATYAEGESDPTLEQSATPFNAQALVMPDSMYIEVTQGPTPFDTTMVISNIGDGWLDFEITEYNYRPDDSRARPALDWGSFDLPGLLERLYDSGLLVPPTEAPTMVPPDPESWRHLIHDPDEFFTTKDIKNVYGQHDVANVWLKFDSWSDMGDPDELIAGFAFDVDLDPATGSPDLPGVEFIAASAGPFMPGMSVILEYNPSSEMGWDVVGFPHWFVSSPDSIGIGITKSNIGNPASVYVSAAILTIVGETPIPQDIAPDLGEDPVLYILTDAWWLTEDPITGTVTGGTAQDINLHVDVPSMAVGEYYAWLYIEMNDLSDPVRVVPVVCKVNPVGVGETRKPTALALNEPIPNPFNARCALEFSVPGGSVELDVFDISGRKTRALYSGKLEPGYYKAAFDGLGDSGEVLPTGIYFARLRCDNKSIVRKMLLVK